MPLRMRSNCGWAGEGGPCPAWSPGRSPLRHGCRVPSTRGRSVRGQGLEDSREGVVGACLVGGPVPHGMPLGTNQKSMGGAVPLARAGVPRSDGSQGGDGGGGAAEDARRDVPAPRHFCQRLVEASCDATKVGEATSSRPAPRWRLGDEGLVDVEVLSGRSGHRLQMNALSTVRQNGSSAIIWESSRRP